MLHENIDSALSVSENCAQEKWQCWVKNIYEDKKKNVYFKHFVYLTFVESSTFTSFPKWLFGSVES